MKRYMQKRHKKVYIPDTLAGIWAMFNENRASFHIMARKWYRGFGERGTLFLHYNTQEPSLFFATASKMVEMNALSPVPDDQIEGMIATYNPATEFVVFVYHEPLSTVLSGVVALNKAVQND